jgi:hypothetical protein
MSEWTNFGGSILVALFCFAWVYMNRGRFVGPRRRWNFAWFGLGLFWLALGVRDLLKALQVFP